MRKPKARRRRSRPDSRKPKPSGRPGAGGPPQVPDEQDEAVSAAEEQTCRKLMEEFGFSPNALPALREFRRIHGGGLY